MRTRPHGHLHLLAINPNVRHHHPLAHAARGGPTSRSTRPRPASAPRPRRCPTPAPPEACDEDAPPTPAPASASAHETSRRSWIATWVSVIVTNRSRQTKAQPAHMRIPTRPSSPTGHHLPHGCARARRHRHADSAEPGWHERQGDAHRDAHLNGTLRRCAGLARGGHVGPGRPPRSPRRSARRRGHASAAARGSCARMRAASRAPASTAMAPALTCPIASTM